MPVVHHSIICCAKRTICSTPGLGEEEVKGVPHPIQSQPWVMGGNWGLVRRGWKLLASEAGRVWGHGPWPVLLCSGKGHVALGLWMATRDRDFGGLCDFLATTGNGGKSLQVRGGTCPNKGSSLGLEAASLSILVAHQLMTVRQLVPDRNVQHWGLLG